MTINQVVPFMITTPSQVDPFIITTTIHVCLVSHTQDGVKEKEKKRIARRWLLFEEAEM